MKRADTTPSTDGCGFLLLFFWIILSCGGVLLPNAEARPVYTFLRTLAGKPVLGALIMATLMPIYLIVSAAEITLRAVWATTLGKVILTLGGWLVPKLGCEATGKWDGYTTIRELAQTPSIGGPSAVISLPLYAIYKMVV